MVLFGLLTWHLRSLLGLQKLTGLQKLGPHDRNNSLHPVGDITRIYSYKIFQWKFSGTPKSLNPIGKNGDLYDSSLSASTLQYAHAPTRARQAMEEQRICNSIDADHFSTLKSTHRNSQAMGHAAICCSRLTRIFTVVGVLYITHIGLFQYCVFQLHTRLIAPIIGRINFQVVIEMFVNNDISDEWTLESHVPSAVQY